MADSGENNVTISSSFSAKLIKWRVSEGQDVKERTVLALYERLGQSEEQKGFNLQPKLKSTVNGRIKKLLVQEGDVVLPGKPVIQVEQSVTCEHHTVMKDLCCDCGMDLRKLNADQEEPSSPTLATVSMIHNIPELKVTKNEAEAVGKKDEERLLNTRKLALVVDLDQTMIHTTIDLVPNDMKDVYHFNLSGYPVWYHTKFRPFAHEFLENISKLYELHIFTMGSRLYAHTIARMLDPDEHLFGHRIRSRDDCFNAFSKSNDLKSLFPRGDSMVCIIDDRTDVWNNAPNLIKVKPYQFFKGVGDINAPVDKQHETTSTSGEAKTDEKNDEEDNGNKEEGETSANKDDMEVEEGETKEGNGNANVEEKENSANKDVKEVEEGETSDNNVEEKENSANIDVKEVEEGETSDNKDDMEVEEGETKEGNGNANIEKKENSANKDVKEVEEGETKEGNGNANIEKQENSANKDVKEVEEGETSDNTDVIQCEEDDNDVEKVDCKAEKENVSEKDQVGKESKETCQDSCKNCNVSEKSVEENNENNTIKSDVSLTSEISKEAKDCDESDDAKSNHDDETMETNSISEKADDKAEKLNKCEKQTENEMHEEKKPSCNHTQNDNKLRNEASTNVNSKNDANNGDIDKKEKDNSKDMKICNNNNSKKDEESKETEQSDVKKSETRENGQDKTTTKAEEKDKTSKKASDNTRHDHIDDDDYLIHVEDVLRRIHDRFYETVDQIKELKAKGIREADSNIARYCSPETLTPCTKQIIRELQSEVLKGANVVFTGVIPTNIPPEKSDIWQRTERLGAKVSRSLVTPKQARDPSNVTTHVIAARLGTEKTYHAIKTRGIKIVKPDWLWSCEERWEWVDERLFAVEGVDKYKKDTRHQRTPQGTPQGWKKVARKEDDANDENDIEDAATNEDDSARERTCSSSSADLLMASLHPLLSFSSLEMEAMDKEVEDLMNSSEDESDVIGSISGSSSSSSASASSSSSSNSSPSADVDIDNTKDSLKKRKRSDSDDNLTKKRKSKKELTDDESDDYTRRSSPSDDDDDDVDDEDGMAALLEAELSHD